MANPEKILVLGLGELGLATIVAISKKITQQTKPVSVSVLLRPSTIETPSASKARDLELVQSLGVSLVPGDLRNFIRDDLIAIFHNYDCIVNCSGIDGAPEALVDTVRMVLEAKIPFFLPWQFGVDYDQVGYGSAQKIWDAQLDVRNLLRAHTQEKSAAGETRTQWAIVQTGIFTSFLFEPWFGVVDMGGSHGPVVNALGGWENGVTTTSPQDIGRVTARVMFDPSLRDQIVKCAGDTITYASLAAVVEDVAQQPVERKILELELLERQVKSHPEDNVKLYQAAFAKGTGCSWALEETINYRKGMKLQSVYDFAREKFHDSNKQEHQGGSNDNNIQ